MIKVNRDFLDHMSRADDFNAAACIHCGSCTALCPVGVAVLPRLLFRYVLMGAKDLVLENQETVYSCLLCGMCEDNCPAGVNITDNMRALRTYFNENVFALSGS